MSRVQTLGRLAFKVWPVNVWIVTLKLFKFLSWERSRLFKFRIHTGGGLSVRKQVHSYHVGLTKVSTSYQIVVFVCLIKFPCLYLIVWFQPHFKYLLMIDSEACELSKMEKMVIIALNCNCWRLTPMTTFFDVVTGEIHFSWADEILEASLWVQDHAKKIENGVEMKYIKCQSSSTSLEHKP